MIDYYIQLIKRPLGYYKALFKAAGFEIVKCKTCEYKDKSLDKNVIIALRPIEEVPDVEKPISAIKKSKKKTKKTCKKSPKINAKKS